MRGWYELTNALETETSELDELTQKRIEMAVLSAAPKRKSRLRIALAAAVLVLLTACSVAVIRYANWFGALVNPYAPGDSEDLLASIGTVIGQSQTVDGVTVTLHGALHDGNYFLLSLSVEGLEEKRYSSQVNDGDSWLSYSPEALRQLQSEKNLPELTAEQYKQMVQSQGTGVILRRQFDQERCLLLAEPLWMPETGREVILHLENFEVQGQTVEGPFEFAFTPEEKEVSRTLSGSVYLTAKDGTPYEVTGVCITPLNISVLIRGPMDEQGQPPVETPAIDGVRLSGEDWTWSSRSGSWVENAGNGFWEGGLMQGPLERIIDPKTVEAVQIDGIWVDLKQFQ